MEMSFNKSVNNGLPQEEVTPTRKETNLYLCKADIFVPRTEIPTAHKHLTKILSHVDPGWKFIRIRNNEGSPLNVTDQCPKPIREEKNENTTIQTISVNLFLNELHYQEVLETIHTEIEIWQLRHTIKLLNNFDSSTVIGCMEFYEYSPDLPLWAISPIHFGCKVLRFNIFVHDFEIMREYYEKLLSQPCCFLRKGFCIFKVHSYPGLEVQISLKCETNTKLRHTRSAVLRLKFKKLDVARLNSASSNFLERIKPQVWRTKDPEGNVILLEETGNQSPRKIKRRSKTESTKDELVFV